MSIRDIVLSNRCTYFNNWFIPLEADHFTLAVFILMMGVEMYHEKRIHERYISGQKVVQLNRYIDNAQHT